MSGMNYPQDINYGNQQSHPGYSLYVGNIDQRLTERVFWDVLYQFFPGQVIACKFFEEVGVGESYCFVMFTDPAAASAALNILNGRQIYDKKIRVNWACPPSSAKTTAFNENDGHAVYVGDLGAEIEDQDLQEAFRQFGDVRGAKIMRDADTGMPKGYGFVVFAQQPEAERAISRMNGSVLGTRPIKVSWATRAKSSTAAQSLNYSDVYTQSPEENTTIYVGCLPASMNDVTCHQLFEPYGGIRDCKYFPDKRYAFVSFDNHEAATNAIVRTHGMVIEGNTIRCWWSKENMMPPMFAQPPEQPPSGGMYPPQFGVPPPYGQSFGYGAHAQYQYYQPPQYQ